MTIKQAISEYMTPASFKFLTFVPISVSPIYQTSNSTCNFKLTGMIYLNKILFLPMHVHHTAQHQCHSRNVLYLMLKQTEMELIGRA
jgi:hypothetical protein